MHAGEASGGLLHTIEIERLLHPPHERLGERRSPSRYLIQVASCECGVPRVKAMRDAVDGEDVDVRWQIVVDGAPQCFRRQRPAYVEVRDLPQRVDAGISAPRSHELKRLVARRLADRALELALHRARVLLLLPAAVLRSRVFDCELVSRHSSL